MKWVVWVGVTIAVTTGTVSWSPAVMAQASTPTPESSPESTLESSPSPAPLSLPATTPSPSGTPFPPRPTPVSTVNPDSVTDAEIERLVKALQAIQPLVEKASRDLQSSTDPARRQQIESEFEAAATKLVTEQTLTPERYRDLINLANSNPVFRRRVQAKLEPSPSPDASAAPTEGDEATDAMPEDRPDAPAEGADDGTEDLNPTVP